MRSSQLKLTKITLQEANIIHYLELIAYAKYKESNLLQGRLSLDLHVLVRMNERVFTSLSTHC